MSQEDLDRYYSAAGKMQAGIAFLMKKDATETQPKHLRVGINSALVEHCALARLLMQKGIITLDEYEKSIADEMENEAEKYQTLVSEAYGANVTLGGTLPKIDVTVR